jgi:hypothetical protein
MHVNKVSHVKTIVATRRRRRLASQGRAALELHSLAVGPILTR